MRQPGLLIAAPASGAGKTTVMLGLLAAFRAQGLAVQPFKSGPDYIDPAFHAAAARRPSYNLDSWAMTSDRLVTIVERAQGADLVLAEGSMGLFDGVASPGEAGTGASADIAARMGWPVVLVIDVSGQAQSAAAVARGFASQRPDVELAGVVLNRVASARHETLVRAGMIAAGIPVFGALPRRADLALPERHLGLVQAVELPNLAENIEAIGAFIAAHIDLPALRAAARCTPHLKAEAAPALRPPGQRVALARDTAFSFVYPHVLDAWQAAGATVLPFSPLANEPPDETADVCWLPGGYPELHAGRLAAADRFRTGLRAFAETRPVHGECGGYMAMGAGLLDAAGQRHQMAGLLGLVTSFEKRRMHLGYRTAQLASGIPGCAADARLRGHEFHYATIIEQPDAPLALVTDATGTVVPETGSHVTLPRGGRATGTFFHMIAEAT
jgi:cobyrinic acid a,c-diamide synthase